MVLGNWVGWFSHRSFSIGAIRDGFGSWQVAKRTASDIEPLNMTLSPIIKIIFFNVLAKEVIFSFLLFDCASKHEKSNKKLVLAVFLLVDGLVPLVQFGSPNNCFNLLEILCALYSYFISCTIINQNSRVDHLKIKGICNSLSML